MSDISLSELQEMRRMREEYLERTLRVQKGMPSRSTTDTIDNNSVDSHVINPHGNPILPDDMLPVKSGLLPGYRPSETELIRYLKKWDGLRVYVEHEEALNMLFLKLPDFIGNTSMKHVIVKCAVLNDFYATNIFQIEPVARKIVSISDFDQRIKEGDEALVHEIAEIENFPRIYSFATKYCAHHNPVDYAIYDRYVADVLMFLKKQFHEIIPFHKREQLKDYHIFKNTIRVVQEHFGLQAYTLKDIDRYLWQLGKDYYNPYVKN